MPISSRLQNVSPRFRKFWINEKLRNYVEKCFDYSHFEFFNSIILPCFKILRLGSFCKALNEFTAISLWLFELFFPCGFTCHIFTKTAILTCVTMMLKFFRIKVHTTAHSAQFWQIGILKLLDRLDFFLIYSFSK